MSVQIKLSLEREAMKMCRQLVGAISASRSYGEECLELRPDSVDVLLSLLEARCVILIRFRPLKVSVQASSHGTMCPFKASKHGEQASSIFGELMRLGTLQGFNTGDKIVSKAKTNMGHRCPGQITRAGETKDIEPEHIFGMGQSVPPVEMGAGKPCIIVPESP